MTVLHSCEYDHNGSFDCDQIVCWLAKLAHGLLRFITSWFHQYWNQLTRFLTQGHIEI